MKVLNPCCCCRLQTGTKIVAIVDIVVGILSLLISILELFGISIDVDDETEGGLSGDETTWVRIVVKFLNVLSVGLAIAILVAGFVLYFGAKDRNYWKCKFWLIVTIVYINFQLTILIVVMSLSRAILLDKIVEAVADTLIVGYQIWVVFAFMQEIKYGPVPVARTA